METTQKTHTPGPWHLHNMEQNTVCGPDYGAIAFANTRRDKREDHANARLIAAAPELLEACKQTVKYLNFYNLAEKEMMGYHLKNTLQKVIDLAERGE